MFVFFNELDGGQENWSFFFLVIAKILIKPEIVNFDIFANLIDSFKW